MNIRAAEPTIYNLNKAVSRLNSGGLVAFPTETVYGLGADAENPEAIASIYATKNRPSNHPLIVHVAKNANIEYWCANVSDNARALINAFWPGPLTLILPRSKNIPAEVSGGNPTIGIRCPSHPVAQQLLSMFAQSRKNVQGGLAAPSANKFGHVSPTQASHVIDEFSDLTSDKLMVLDGGASDVGIESTIVDVSSADGRIIILRPGHILPEQIERVTGQQLSAKTTESPQVSGSLKAHYAPRNRLIVASANQFVEVLTKLAKDNNTVAVAVLSQEAKVAVSKSGANVLCIHICSESSVKYAHELYDTLRKLDNSGASHIVFEQPTQTQEWQAINDRLGRAAAAFDLD